jgi:hypothetical protein
MYIILKTKQTSLLQTNKRGLYKQGSRNMLKNMPGLMETGGKYIFNLGLNVLVLKNVINDLVY